MSWQLVTDVEAKWPEVFPLLEPALAECHGEFTAEQLKSMLCARKMSLLVYDRGDETYCLACVFELVHYPAKKAMRVVLLAGDAGGNAYADWETEVEAFARAMGANELEAWCGDVQARHFRKWGLRKRYNIVTKEIGHAG